MAPLSLEEVYTRYVKPMTTTERLRLVARVTQDIADTQASDMRSLHREYSREEIAQFLEADQVEPELASKVERLLAG